MRKLNNKGFTLVEIVIVIVIIAILAAMLVPALTQWIDKSKLKTFTSACGTIRTSVQAAISEEYAVNSSVTQIKDVGVDEAEATIGADIGKTVELKPAATVEAGTVSDGKDFAIDEASTADDITITDGAFIGTWNGSSWDVEKKS